MEYKALVDIQMKTEIREVRAMDLGLFRQWQEMTSLSGSKYR
jgi:hypothetical protein